MPSQLLGKATFKNNLHATFKSWETVPFKIIMIFIFNNHFKLLKFKVNQIFG